MLPNCIGRLLFVLGLVLSGTEAVSEEPSDEKFAVVNTEAVLNQDLDVNYYTFDNGESYFVGIANYHNPSFSSGSSDIKFKGDKGTQLNYDNEFGTLVINKTFDASGIQANRTNIEKNVGGMGTNGVASEGFGPGRGIGQGGAGHAGFGGNYGDSTFYGKAYGKIGQFIGGSTAANFQYSWAASGGGIIIINAPQTNFVLTENGTITVKGESPILDTKYFIQSDPCSGGSSGGYVQIKAYKITIYGKVEAQGGDGGSFNGTFCGGGAGGGIIELNALEAITVYGSLNLDGGRGLRHGGQGKLSMSTTIQNMEINTDFCYMRSTEFGSKSLSGKIIDKSGQGTTCKITLRNNFHLKSGGTVTLTGKNLLWLIGSVGSTFRLDGTLKVMGDENAMVARSSSRFLGGYHNLNGFSNAGPTSGKFSAFHGSRQSIKNFDIKMNRLLGGSSCTEISNGIGGGSIVIQVEDGNIEITESGSIRADGFSWKTNSGDKCGASGGTIRLKAKSIAINGVLSAKGAQGSKSSGEGGIIIVRSNTLNVGYGASLNVSGGDRPLNESLEGTVSLLNLTDNVRTSTQSSSAFQSQAINPSSSTENGLWMTTKEIPPTSSLFDLQDLSTSFVSSGESLNAPNADKTKDSQESFSIRNMETPSTVSAINTYFINQSKSSAYIHISTSSVKQEPDEEDTLIRPELQEIGRTNVTTQGTLAILRNVTKTKLNPSEIDFTLQVYRNISFAKFSRSTYTRLEIMKELLLIADNLLENSKPETEQENTPEKNKKFERVLTTVVSSLTFLSVATGRSSDRKNQTVVLRSKSTAIEIITQLPQTSNSTSKNITFPQYCNTREPCQGLADVPQSLLDFHNYQFTVTSIVVSTDYGNFSRVKTKNNSEIGSQILSLNVFPKPTEPFNQRITIKQRYKTSAKKEQRIPRTAFWANEIAQSGGHWSFSGITTLQSNDTTITSSVHHLTSFAVLVQVTDFEISEEHQLALSIITYVGCGFSLFAYLLTFGTLASIEALASERSRVHLNLVLALGIGQAIFLLGISATGNTAVCTGIAVSLHYFFTAGFSWMLVEGLVLYSKVVRVFHNGKNYIKYYLCIGWGLPAILVGISTAIKSDGYGNDRYCWISIEDGLVWAFVGPVVAVILINLFILVWVIKILMTSVSGPVSTHPKTKEQIRAAIKGILMLTPILGITWVFGMFAVDSKTIVMQYIFTIFNAFQGLVIFGFYCIGNNEVQTALKRLHLKHTENFTSSLFRNTNTTSDSIELSTAKHKKKMKSIQTKIENSPQNSPSSGFGYKNYR